MPVAVKSPDLAEMLRTLQAASKDAPKAFGLAMKASRGKSKADTAVQSSAIYNLPEKRVTQDLTVTPIVGYTYSVIGRKRKRGPSLISYGATQNATGLAVTVIKGRGAKRIPSGFIRRGLGGANSEGSLLPFVRAGSKRKMKKGRYAGKVRQPIKALYGPSVADMLTNNDVYNPIKARFVTVVSDELSKRISRALRRG